MESKLIYKTGFILLSCLLLLVSCTNDEPQISYDIFRPEENPNYKLIVEHCELEYKGSPQVYSCRKDSFITISYIVDKSSQRVLNRHVRIKFEEYTKNVVIRFFNSFNVRLHGRSLQNLDSLQVYALEHIPTQELFVCWLYPNNPYHDMVIKYPFPQEEEK